MLNYAGVSSLTPTEISLGAERLLTFIDMGGHERCLKTCLWGMTCMLPDYAVLCICAAGGLGRWVDSGEGQQGPDEEHGDQP